MSRPKSSFLDEVDSRISMAGRIYSLTLRCNKQQIRELAVALSDITWRVHEDRYPIAQKVMKAALLAGRIKYQNVTLRIERI